MEKGIERLLKLIPLQLVEHLPHRWLALQFFEGNKTVHEYLATLTPDGKLKSLFEEIEQAVKEENKVSGLSQWMYRVRRSYISTIVGQAVDKKEIND